MALVVVAPGATLSEQDVIVTAALA